MFSWSNGIQREVIPASSLTLSSQSRSPHHIVFTKPPFEILKALVTINKVYETENGVEKESNITFNIIDKNDKIYQTITTNENGIAQIYLPYGKYKIEQLTSKEGYNKIEPFEIEIKDTNQQEFNLTNYKIKIPNTSTSLISDIIRILKTILGIIIYV